MGGSWPGNVVTCWARWSAFRVVYWGVFFGIHLAVLFRVMSVLFSSLESWCAVTG